MNESKRVTLEKFPNLPEVMFQYMIGCVGSSSNSTTHATTVLKMFCPAKFIVKNVTPVCCIKKLVATRCRWIVVYEFTGDALKESDTEVFTSWLPLGLFVIEYRSDKQKTLTVIYGVHCCIC